MEEEAGGTIVLVHMTNALRSRIFPTYPDYS